MTCLEAKSAHSAERYLSDTLAPEELPVFEEHYLGCNACFAEVENLRHVQTALARDSSRIRSLPVPKRSFPAAWILAAAACLLIGGLLVFPRAHQAAAPVAVATAIAPLNIPLEWTAPAYVPMQLRGTSTERNRSFRDAMVFYSAGNYSAAAEHLRGTVALDPAWVPARFYLGTSELLAGDDAAGTRDLAGLPDSEAHLLLAKSAIRTRHFPEARALLMPLSEKSAEAKKLLTLLP